MKKIPKEHRRCSIIVEMIICPKTPILVEDTQDKGY